MWHGLCWPSTIGYLVWSTQGLFPSQVASLWDRTVTYMPALDHDSAVCSLVCSPVLLGLSFFICEVDMIVLTL